MLTFGNVITAMVTPFYADGNINFEDFDSLAGHLLANGSDGLLIGGTTGEGATLTEKEKLRLFRFAAEETGVDCLLAIVPYYNKPNQDGCYAHFAAVAKACRLPVIIYNVPGRTGGKILPETVIRLAKEFPRIVGIKEAGGDLEAAAVIARDTGENFHVYSGDDSLTLPMTAVGGTGVISVVSHLIGKEMNAIVQNCKDGNMKEATALHQQYIDVMTGIFTTVNPIPIKECCKMLGLISDNVFRLPMVNASYEVMAFLEKMMKNAGILGK